MRLLFLALVPTCSAYLVLLLSEDDAPGSLVLDAGLPDSRRRYSLDRERSAPFVHDLLHVRHRSGSVFLKKWLSCVEPSYPNLFTLYIDSTSNGTLEYVSLPVRVLIKGCKDRLKLEDGIVDDRFEHKLKAARQWSSETVAVYTYPGYKGGEGEVCLRSSQPVAKVYSLVPDSVRSNCSIRWSNPTQPEWALEPKGGDIVASRSMCLVAPVTAPWTVDLVLDYSCPQDLHLISPAQHAVRVEVWFRDRPSNQSDDVNRVRRTLHRPGITDPTFDRSLYVASVLEEQDPGVEVCQVQAKSRDPGLIYSMISLLDQRSQTMFAIDPTSGIVTTTATLDREVMQVHYLRVTALDETGLPPRSATTTLQVNVGDVNDHKPTFESSQIDVSLSEASPVGTVVTQLRASDLDTGINAQIEYSLVEVESGGLDDGKELFAVDPSSGLVTTRRALDRETSEVYTILAKGTDMGNGPQGRLSATVTVVVRVQDENDNYPQFAQRTLTVTLDEDTTTVSSPIVASVKATDADSGLFGALRYNIIAGNTQGAFAIDSESGDITLVKPLDYETTPSYRLSIRAQDGGSPPKANTTQVLINVRDVNDNAPRFYTSLFQESVSENVPVGFSIVRVQAYDGDEGENAEVSYVISSHFSPENLPVTVDQNSGWLYTTRQLDREIEPKLNFEVLAVDKGTPSKTGTTTVSIVVQDTNDNDPLFSPKEYSSNLSEDTPPGTSVVSVHATDPDENPRLHYEIVSGNTRGRFAITTQNGRGLITLAQPLDFKQERRFILSVRATDSGGRFDTANVYLNISDANNFAPVFDNTPYSATVPEDSKIGTTVLVVSASDADTGVNAQVSYTLTSETDHFAINADTGAITTTTALDRETTSGYLLTVTAKDNGAPQLSDNTDVEITVTDVNDNAPKFTQEFYTVSVSEDVPIGTSVIQVSASDSDLGLNGRVRYSVENTDMFIMEPITGVMRVNKALDRESVALYNIVAVASDRATPPLSTTVIIEVSIEDVNDSPPSFESDRLTLYIQENSPIGSVVGEIYAKDPDTGPNAVVHYSIIGGEDASLFSLRRRVGSDSAELVTLTEVDYESEKKEFHLVIRATSAPLRSDAHLTVVVTDVNDNAPVLPDFQVIFNNFKECFPSGPIGKIPANDADVSDKLKFRILSGNNAGLVILNSTSGEISLSPQLNTNVPKVATMEVSVSDGVNEVKAWMELTVRLITEEMLLNSVTVRLADMTERALLSPLLGYFTEAIAAVVPCPKHNVYVFSIQDDIDPEVRIVNVSFSVRKPDGDMFPSQLLQEKVYLYRALLTKLSTLQVLPFDDNLCVREPCLNFEQCSTVLKFGNASDFISSDTVLFRPIYPVTTFSCTCPTGFLGKREHYLCDTEINMCYSNPCKNGGECIQAEGGYTCVCKEGYTGDTCDTDMSSTDCAACPPGTTCVATPTGGYTCESCTPAMSSFSHYDRFCRLRARSFVKNTFITFPALRQRNRLHIILKFATVASSGLLLYNGRYNDEHDFIALELLGSSVRFSFSLGDSVTRVAAYSDTPLNDGLWHTVTISYYNRTAKISLDDCDTWLAVKYGLKINSTCAAQATHNLEPRCASVTESCQRFLDLTGPLHVGGVPALSERAGAFAQPGFVGCIADIHIDHKLLDLNMLVGNNGSKVGCLERESHCGSSPCKNGGTCRETWDGYVCDCPDGWGRQDCSFSSAMPWRFADDSQLVFNPLLRPVQLPWETEFSFRTRQREAFILAVTVGQNYTVMFTIEGGCVRYSIDGEGVTLTSWPIADGLWHRVSSRLEVGRRVILSVDHDARSASAVLHSSIHNQMIGKLSVGNSELTNLPGFNGCLKDIKLGTSTGLQLLQRPAVSSRVTEGCDSPMDCELPCRRPNSRCQSSWQFETCTCNSGYVGNDCDSVCDLDPCENNGRCQLDRSVVRGYSCLCPAAFGGEYCEEEKAIECPASWWGDPDCGPCGCDLSRGYSPQCNSTTGQCYCKARHWLVSDEEGCRPCDCYPAGSRSLECDYETGQCDCKSGVVGVHCDQCPSPYAQVTPHGCEVIYGGCPRHLSSSLWWEKTEYGATVSTSCPPGAKGIATRKCDRTLPGWRPPDMFNCTSDAFVPLSRLLGQMASGDVVVNTYVAAETSRSIGKALNSTSTRYGADWFVATGLLGRLLEYESQQSGLALTHSHQANYIKELVWSLGEITASSPKPDWERIEAAGGNSPIALHNLFTAYMATLATNMTDTYTPPMEAIAPDMVFGLDVVSSDSLYGYEVAPRPLPMPGTNQETIILPDTSNILLPPIVGSLISHRSNASSSSPTIMFPKYNNYLKQKGKFDDYTKILIPLDLLGIKHLSTGEVMIGGGPKYIEKSGIVSYAFYKHGTIFPSRYDNTVTTRWGVELLVSSSVVTIVAVNKDGVVLSTGLKSPVRLQMWLRTDIPASPRSNPQCVRWTHARGVGEWTRAGCLTELPPGDWWTLRKVMVNCTCTTLSTHAVLTDLTPLPYVRESTAVEEMSTWFGLVASIWLLALALLGVSLVGSKSILSSVYYNQIMCLFLAQILYCVGLKAAVRLASHQVGCKLVAISLHYLWLSSLCWWMLSSVHLLRMLASVRDVNRGPMIHYYTLSYAGPGIVVALAVAIRPHHYGNFYFCWISLYESAIWSMLGPGFLIIVVNLIAMFLALRAAFIVNHTIASYGNVRLLVWLNVGGLPLTVGAWLVSLMVASEHSTLATVALSAVLPAHSLLLFLTVVSCLDPTLRRMALRLISSKVPPAAQEDSSSPVRPTPTARSSMTYRAAATGSTTGGDPSKRHIGISNASTTSRSTTKTSSSPYRSDNQLRNTSTSSNYEHASSDNRRVHHASDSDSEEGDGRSLELASSHSSDEESTVTRRRPERPESRHIDPPASYDTLVASGALDALNIAYNVYQTRPAPPLYTNIEEPPGAQRWTRSTISDNEVAATSTARHEPSKISNLYGGEEEKTLNDKYLFPYTAEEDHSLCGGPSALRGSAERLDNSPSPLAMHHHQFLSQDSEKSTSETPV